MESARFAIEVVAGVIPGRVDDFHSRRWVVSSSEWQKAVDDGKESELLAKKSGEAAGYAQLLQLQPDRLNWVSTTWTWF